MDLPMRAVCPFCGSPEFAVLKSLDHPEEDADFMVMCQRCRGSGPQGKSEQEAIDRWRTRVRPKLLPVTQSDN